MTYKEFQESLPANAPPKWGTQGLKAVWYAAKDDWDASHNIAQEMHTPMGSLIHAYLHRKEGDAFNAGYWYRQAGKPFPNISVEAELQEIVEAVLATKKSRSD